MDLLLVAIGLGKIAFGLLVGVVGITLSARLIKRFIGIDSIDECIRDRNVAVGTVFASAILAMGLVMRHAVTGTFSALDLLRYQAERLEDLLWVLVYAALHTAATLCIATFVLGFGIRSFLKLTPDIDEVLEIRQGNLASGLVLAAVTITLAMLVQQGLETILDALLPFPTMGRDLVAPE